MNKAELQRLSSIRRKEAKRLLDSRMFQGAYYLAGYSIECALKACICRQTKKHDFPDKEFANDAYTHNLEKLIKCAGLRVALDTERNANKACWLCSLLPLSEWFGSSFMF